MNTRKINGLHMEKMLRNGLENLRMNEEKLNRLNVFPVTDGDTGTNMCITLESGIRGARSTNAMGAYLKMVSNAMLYGARGNSGVILSQIVRGIFLALSSCGNVNVSELKNAFISGYKTAYAAVVRPVEGTMLTVAREGVEHIRNSLDRSTTVEDFLSLYLIEMRRSLARTPEMLPPLKEAGVVDSGALGYILMVEGMLKYLNGEVLLGSGEMPTQDFSKLSTDVSLFNENTVFASGYCVEFVLQLMRGRQYSQYFNLERFKSDLEDFGGSMVVVQNGKRIKVHIHTFKPAKVLGLAQEFGEFVSCKVENMQLQYNSLAADRYARSAEQKRSIPAVERAKFALVSAADSEKMCGVLESLGCGKVIMGGEKMSVSVQEFIDAVKEVNADNVAILPNNSNLIRAAEQAGELYKGSRITVIPTETVPQGYCAVAMDVADEESSEARIRHLSRGMKNVTTLDVGTAKKGYSGTLASCREGDMLALLNGTPLCTGGSAAETFLEGLKKIPGIEDAEVCTVFRGEGTAEKLESALRERIAEAFPELELSFVDGGSRLYILSAAIS